MTQEEKELLLKDLCSRLPYKVKIECINSDNETVIEELFSIGIEEDTFDCNMIEYISVKPYLFPLSSMTEEQKEELRLEHEKDLKTMAICMKKCSEGDTSLRGKNILYHSVDWCNENHFDYRGLIEKGLAIDCINLNIY